MKRYYVSPSLGNEPIIWTSKKGNLVGHRQTTWHKDQKYATRLAPVVPWRFADRDGRVVHAEGEKKTIMRQALYYTKTCRSVDDVRLHVYSLWPVRHFVINSMTETIRGSKFDLDLELVFKMYRYWTPKRTRQWIEELQAKGAWLPKWAESGVHPCRALVNTLPPRVRKIADKMSTQSINTRDFIKAAYVNMDICTFAEREPFIIWRIVSILPVDKGPRIFTKTLPFKTLKAAIRAVLRMSRKDILCFAHEWEAVEYVPNKLLKNLRKLSIREASTAKGMSLHTLHSSCCSKIACHLPFLTYPVLSVIDDALSKYNGDEKAILRDLTMAFWTDLNNQARYRALNGGKRQKVKSVVQDFRDIERLQLEIADREVVPIHRVVNSVNDLLQFHEDLVRQLAGIRHIRAAKPFAPPPFPGTEEIIPLSSAAELDDEGKEMHHCVGSYARAVKERTTYIYSVRVGEAKATMEVSRCYGKWEVRQLRGVCNRSPATEIKEVVEAWAQRHGLSAPAIRPLEFPEDIEQMDVYPLIRLHEGRHRVAPPVPVINIRRE
jgi:hypothetical protein